MECTFFAAIGEISDARRALADAGRKGGEVLLHVFGAEGEVQAAQLAWEHRLVAERALDVRAIVYDAALSGSVALRGMVESRRRHRRNSSSSSLGSLSSSENVGRIRGHKRGGSHGSGKGYDFNVVSGAETRSVGEVFQAVVGYLLAFLAAVGVYVAAIITSGSDRVSSTVRRASSTGSKAKVQASRQSLDDAELVGRECRRCYVYPGVGKMSIFQGSVVEQDVVEEKRQERRDSGFQYEGDEVNRQAEEARQTRACRGRDVRFGKVGDEEFWEGVRGAWVE